MRPARIHRLLLGGALDLALLAILAVVTVAIGLNIGDPLSLAIDLVACVAAAFTIRWPRSAGAALGLIVAVYAVFPDYYFIEMGEYATLVVALGTGIRGQRRTRALLTAGYLVILTIHQFQLYVDARAFLSVLAWIALFGVMWLIGSSIAGFNRAQQQAQLAALAQQRLALARELHDTVARSLARISRQTHEAATSGDATELASIADQVSQAASELRWVLGALRDSDAELLVSSHSSLAIAVRDSVEQLQAHGFQVSTSIDGSLDDVPAELGSVLAEIVKEAAANVERHGATGQPCVLTVSVDDTAADLAFINEVRESGTSSGSSRPLGLLGAAERLALVGGQLEARQEGNHWITRVMIPLAGRT